jgi:hypothetical protein
MKYGRGNMKEEEIKKLIENSKKDYDKKTQRAALLKRNKNFLNELGGIKKRLGNEFYKVKDVNVNKIKEITNDNIMLKLDYPKANIFISEEPLEEVDMAYVEYLFYGEFDGYNPRAAIKDDSYFKNSPDLDTVIVYDEDLNSLQTKITCKFQVLRAYVEKWIEFCAKWQIDSSWGGELSTLSKFQNPLVSISINYRNLGLPIQINIGPWTSWKDIKQRWHEIELIKRTSFSKPKKKSRVFSRDLCWYDLNKKFKLSPGKIGKLWIKHRPEDVDLLVMKKVRRDEKKELSEEKASELLREIKIDPAMNDLKIQFEKEREIYVEGPYSPLKDLIKKAIKSMDSKIKEFEPIKGDPLPQYIPSLESLGDYDYHYAEADSKEKID